MLRLLRRDADIELTLHSLEEVTAINSARNNYAHQKELRNALLEAEYRKAQGLMEWEKSRVKTF